MGTKPHKETNLSCTFPDGSSLDQTDLAILGSALVTKYRGWDAPEAERKAHFLIAANTALTTPEVAEAVAMWVGVYIDECHDTDAEKCGGYSYCKNLTALEWMDWAYDMLTDGAILRLNNG
jgi:hypothetical protein